MEKKSQLIVAPRFVGLRNKKIVLSILDALIAFLAYLLATTGLEMSAFDRIVFAIVTAMFVFFLTFKARLESHRW